MYDSDERRIYMVKDSRVQKKKNILYSDLCYVSIVKNKLILKIFSFIKKLVCSSFLITKIFLQRYQSKYSAKLIAVF